MKFLHENGGYVAPPPEVEHVAEVGFFQIWLTRNTMKHNGVEGKMLYVHWQDLNVARWLFNWSESQQEKKWKSVESFKTEADKAFKRKIKELV